MNLFIPEVDYFLDRVSSFIEENVDYFSLEVAPVIRVRECSSSEQERFRLMILFGDLLAFLHPTFSTRFRVDWQHCTCNLRHHNFRLDIMFVSFDV